MSGASSEVKQGQPELTLKNHKFSLFGSLVGRWNGDVRALQVGSNSPLSWVWYLKLSADEARGQLNYRLIVTSPDGTTRRTELVLTPVADGVLEGKAPFDEHLARCKLTFTENTPAPGFVTFIVTTEEGRTEQVKTFKVGVAGGTTFLSVACQLYSNEGFILSNESSILRRCVPSEPVPYAMTASSSPVPDRSGDVAAAAGGRPGGDVRVEEADA